MEDNDDLRREGECVRFSLFMCQWKRLLTKTPAETWRWHVLLLCSATSASRVLWPHFNSFDPLLHPQLHNPWRTYLERSSLSRRCLNSVWWMINGCGSPKSLLYIKLATQDYSAYFTLASNVSHVSFNFFRFIYQRCWLNYFTWRQWLLILFSVSFVHIKK